MVTRRDYTTEGVEAARSVLIELVHLLGEYKDDIVLIGGWIPEVLLPHYSGPHVGSMDVDIALNHRRIDEGNSYGNPHEGKGCLGHLLLSAKLSGRDRGAVGRVQAAHASRIGKGRLTEDRG